MGVAHAARRDGDSVDSRTRHTLSGAYEKGSFFSIQYGFIHVCGQIDMHLHELRLCCSRCIRKHGRILKKSTYGDLNGYERAHGSKDTCRPAPMKRTPQEIYKATDPAARAQWYLKTVGPPVSADAAEPLCRKRDLYFLSVKITTYWYSYFLTRIKTQRL